MAEPQPYKAAAKAYVARGWLGALPLPPRQKEPVPAGYTGKQHFDVDPTSHDIDEWIAKRPNGNLALRMPRDVLGIDVDMYDGKPGRESLAAAEAKWGPLPATWVSTSRDDGSGIRFFRVPEGMKWPNTVGPGIETVHRGHRYAVAWPSIHPKTGGVYRWVQPNGEPTLWDIPWPSKLPELPPEWVKGLTSGEMDDGPTARAEPPATATTWLTPGDPCAYVDTKLAEAYDALDDAGSRHDNVRDIVLALMFYGQQGHAGVQWALSSLQRSFLAVVGPDRKPGQAEREWLSIVAGAYGIVAAKPRPAEECRGQDCMAPAKLEGLPAEVLGPVVPPSEAKRATLAASEARDGFWDARPELAHLRAFSRARMASPWAVLGCALVRAVCCIEPLVVLPPIIGGEASLNLFVGIVGKSGDGKGAAEAAAKDAIRWTGTLEKGVGSGEGLVHVYVRHKPPRKDDPGGLEQVATRAIFRASEVDTLAALKGRTGSTLLPKLRDAWMGDSLGFAYASQEKALDLSAHMYRMGLIVGVQPERAGVLVDDAPGGTPQRFLWLPANDPAAPGEPGPEVEPWRDWNPPSQKPVDEDGRLIYGHRRIPVCQVARDTVVKARMDRLHGIADALDGHRLLAQLKVAAALGILNGRLSVNEEDWSLAERVMQVSDQTRESIASERRVARQEADERRLKADDQRAQTADRIVAERIARRVIDLVEAAGSEGLTASPLRRKIAARDREALEGVLELLVDRGSLVCEEVEYKGQTGARYWLPGGKR